LWYEKAAKLKKEGNLKAGENAKKKKKKGEKNPPINLCN